MHRFIDTHCHFDFPPFTGDEAQSIKRAAAAGVKAIVVPATEAAHFDRVLELARHHEALYAALGLHPIVIEHHTDDHVDRLDALLQTAEKKLVAIGEIGLDLYREAPHFERQQTILDAQLRLAKRHDLPVILHSRRTHDKLAMHLKRIDLPRKGVVHGFSGSLQQAQRFIELVYKIGDGGKNPYHRARKTRADMAQLPLTSLLLETDAPDMPLNGFQGQPNRPEQAARVFATLCELRDEPEEVIANALLENTRSVFGITL